MAMNQRKSVCLLTPKAPGHLSTAMQPKKGPSATTTSMKVRQACNNTTQHKAKVQSETVFFFRSFFLLPGTSAHLPSQSSSSCPESDSQTSWVLFKDYCYAFNMYNYSVFTMEDAKNVCQNLGEYSAGCFATFT